LNFEPQKDFNQNNDFYFVIIKSKMLCICSVVLDEVDILFGEEGFEQVLHQLITVAPMTTQYLFVTATLPLDIYNKVVETFPDCEVIMGPGVHRTSSRLEEVGDFSFLQFLFLSSVTCASR
jgi:hypothetical protein